MGAQSWFACGAILAALGVLNGAYAAHGLEDALIVRYETMEIFDPELVGRRIGDFEVGVRYQMYHALGLMLLGIVAARRNSPWVLLSGFGFLAGIFIFSGMLYILVLTNQAKLGMFVPIGGVSFVVGWLALAIAGYGGLRTPAELPPPPERFVPATAATIDVSKTVVMKSDQV